MSTTKVFLRAISYTSWKLHVFQCWLQNVLSPFASPGMTNMEQSVSPHTAKKTVLVPLQDFSSARCRGNVAMSRRRVSVKDLGQADSQGWLYKKRDSRTFLGHKWKKYWFVLKGSSLYWYTTDSADKAEGYITLRGFILNQAHECRRKFAIKASHPQVVTLFFAAENTKDMHKWLNKLIAASSKQELTETASEECYSEATDDDEEEETAETCGQHTEQFTTSSISGCLPPPRSCSSPCAAMLPLVSPVCDSTECMSSDTESWLELSSDSQTLQVSISEGNAPGRLQDYHADERPPSDELEMLYLNLKHANLTPCGTLQPLSKQDYRSSFVRRCKNDTINEKLHLVRTLNSTLKAKEADLLAIEQVLADSALDSNKYRQWRSANVLLLEEISKKVQAGEETPQTPQPREPVQSQPQFSTSAIFAETSVEKDTKKTAKALKIPRDAVGSIVHKIKVKGTLATLPGCGRKSKPSLAATTFLRRQVVNNAQVTAKDLQQDLVAAGSEVSVCTVRHILHTDGLHAQPP
ncbi:hypothetical protein AOLI_G00034990 [Acnodon oligacanthus]